MASQPLPPTPPAARKTNASRYLFLFLLGLAVGAVATVMAWRAIDARQDHYPDAVMQVMGKQVGLLQQNASRNRCAVSDTLPRVQSLRTLANEIETAFPDMADDERFIGHASALRATLDTAIAKPPADCAGVGVLARTIDSNCTACHKEFR